MVRGSYGASRGQQAVKVPRNGCTRQQDRRCWTAIGDRVRKYATHDYHDSQGDRTAAGRARQSQARAPRPAASRELNLDVVLDIPVTLSMEVGRTRISIRNLLQLNQGSVIELERAVSEPLDIFVNGTLIAHGEVVVVNDKFGIRLTDVISPAERIRKLK